VRNDPVTYWVAFEARRTGGNLRRIIVVAIALAAGLAVSAELWPDFLNIPSLLLTLGGSIAVILFSYSRRQLCDLASAVHALITEPRLHVHEHIEQLSRLTRVYQADGLRGLENEEERLHDPFLKRGVAMVVDLQKSEKINAVLGDELASVLAQHEISRQILLTLGKLLPAFGLIGTLIGMVMLLKEISGSDPKLLPQALSLAVLTTLYGAVLANVCVAPLAARLHVVAVETETRMRLTLQWLAMLLRTERAVADPIASTRRMLAARSAARRVQNATAAGIHVLG
jgi:chemotaxis protein MotA